MEDITEGKVKLDVRDFPCHMRGFINTIQCITADIISTVEFDHTGNYLATGDKGGRVVLFERNETVGCFGFAFMAVYYLGFNTEY